MANHICGQCAYYHPSDDVDGVGWCEKFITDISAAIIRETWDADDCEFFLNNSSPAHKAALEEKYWVVLDELRIEPM